MAQFLSPAWIDELNQAVADDDHPAGGETEMPDVSVTLQQVVSRPEDPDIAYVMRVEHGQVIVAPGRDEAAEVTLSEDYATAVALSQGKLTAQAALLAGRIRIRGDIAALARSQEALTRVQARLDPVRDRTTY